MIKKYLIKLKPLGKFFFGGDATFKVDSDKSEEYNEKFSSYILHSFKMPQQTSLLGMMRFLLLSNSPYFDRENNRIIDVNSEGLISLIGKESFSVGTPGDFGCIDKIGPCFIWNGKPFFSAPMDADLLIDFNKTVKAKINGVEVLLPDITKRIEKEGDNHFSGKDCLPEKFMAVDGCEASKNLFVKDTRVGINKNYKGKTEKESFFKQVSYRLDDGYCFAFEISIDSSVDLMKYNSQIVQLGADSSSFVFEAELLPVDFTYPVNKDMKVVLLSDTYLDFSEFDDSNKYSFSITRTRPFRFLRTYNSSDKKDYNVKYKSTRCNGRYELFCAGSVFYFTDEERKNKFCELIDKFTEFVKIGYNKYY